MNDTNAAGLSSRIDMQTQVVPACHGLYFHSLHWIILWLWPLIVM